MLDFAARIKEIHPGIYVHSIFIEEDLGKDRQAGFVSGYYISNKPEDFSLKFCTVRKC